METDSSGENVPTFDCCVHPKAIQLSSSSSKSQFKDFLIRTAMDGVQAAYREMNQVVTLENARELKGVVYKSGQPMSMMIKHDDMENKWQEKNDSVNPPKVTNFIDSKTSEKSDASLMPAKTILPSKDSIVITEKVSESGFFKKGFLSNAKKPLYNATQPNVRNNNKIIPLESLKATTTTVAATTIVPSPSMSSSSVTQIESNNNSLSSSSKITTSEQELREAEYTVVERGVQSLGDFPSLSHSVVQSCRPTELVYKFLVPMAVPTRTRRL
jgi:hypothetical protein